MTIYSDPDPSLLFLPSCSNLILFLHLIALFIAFLFCFTSMDQKRRGSLKNSRDQEISELRSRLESQYSRTALVQSQLRATLDTLDEVQAESARVQERYARREKKLIDQLQNYREIARDAQADRDEIRDAAEDVLARVESNYTAPRKLYISSFLEPIVPIVQLSPESDLLNMAASVLNSMRHERDMERTAHEETRTNALAEIAALNARLARRDAELEACVQHKDCSSPVSTSKAEPMSQEEELRVKDIQRARNRELEVEVTSLHNQVRLAAGLSSSVD
ncbi:hypothetical protein C8J56DRAFT_443009 [Mycena floridula]|nr:hypothetical protein C8J56DRAFT_443009 [Mycena floridula]